MIEDRFQIGEIVGKPVAVPGPLRAAKTARIERNQRATLLQLIDNELPGFTGITPAMQQHGGLRIGTRPPVHLKSQMARSEAFELSCTADGISHANGRGKVRGI